MSGTQRLLDRLSDGKFHSHESLYRDLGVMVHSRCADLRRKGHVIHVRREWSKSQRRNFWYYRLASNEAPGLPSDALVVASSAAETAPGASLAAHPTGGQGQESVFSSEPVSLPLPPPTTPTASLAAGESEMCPTLFDMPGAPAWA